MSDSFSEPRGLLSGWVNLFRKQTRRRMNGSSSGGVATLQPQVAVQRRDFLSPVERSFFSVLRSVVDAQVMICPKVRVADLIKAVDYARVDSCTTLFERAHVDFLLCDPATLYVLCAIELDDITRLRPDGEDRNVVMDAAFAAAKIRLIRFPAKSMYAPYEVAERLADILNVPVHIP